MKSCSGKRSNRGLGNSPDTWCPLGSANVFSSISSKSSGIVETLWITVSMYVFLLFYESLETHV